MGQLSEHLLLANSELTHTLVAQSDLFICGKLNVIKWSQ